MLMKGSLLLFFTIFLLNCMKSECREIRCYSCSDCGNSTRLSSKDFITTTRNEDQCMKTTIFTGKFNQGEQLISRGASSNCAQYSSDHIWIFCCNSDLCNS